MAEQKTEDQKPPIARRGARPFAGPASASPAARPFLRPASAGARPAPFAPPLNAARQTLGTAAEPKASVPVDAPTFAVVNTATAPPPAPAEVRHEPDLADALPPEPHGVDSRSKSLTPSFDISLGRWGMATPVIPAPAQSESASVQDDTPAMPVAAASTDEGDYMEPLSPLQARPITSEVVAVDAFDAFEGVWGAAPQPADGGPVDATAPDAASPSPFDASTLGSGDTQEMWAEDVTAGLAGSATTPHAGNRSTPELAMPAWLADDPEPATPAATPDGVDAAADEALGTPGLNSPASQWMQAADVHAIADAAVATNAAQGARVAACLERLAQCVRDGEIDVSSVAPEATDAAVLASVLAALLGGSSSR